MKKRQIYRALTIIIILLLAWFEHWMSLDEWMDHKYSSLSIPIFGFHNVVMREPQNYLDYNYSDLSHFFEYLIRNNYYFLDTAEFYSYFISREKDLSDLNGKKTVMLTFDDGDKVSTQNIFNLINELEIRYQVTLKVVLFVNTDGFNGKSQKVNCLDLKAPLVGDKFDVQSHGHNHVSLLELNNQNLVLDLQKANSIILSCKSKLGVNKQKENILSLAYPFNFWDNRVQYFVKNEYDAAFTYVNSTFRWGWHNNPYEIPRIRVYSRHSPELLITIAQQSHEVSAKQQDTYSFKKRRKRLFMSWL
jgi:poly-beta-1,6-N-acetyl-D-glucosamine N-deacetylase